MPEQLHQGLTFTSWTGPIAIHHQVDVATPNFAIQEMGLGIHYNLASGADLKTYVKEPEKTWAVKDGYIDLPTGPGLGVEIDEEKVREAAKEAKPWFNWGFIGPGGEIREWV